MRSSFLLLATALVLVACGGSGVRPPPFTAEPDDGSTEVEDAASASCIDSCLVGDRQCVDGGVELCATEDGGCAHFVPQEQCGSGVACVASECLSRKPCPTACPPQHVCDPSGVCVSEAGIPLILNVETAQVHGNVLLDGQLPVIDSSRCRETGNVALDVTFWGESNDAFLSTVIPCQTKDFGFDAYLPRGRYRVLIEDAFSVASPEVPLVTNLPRETYIADVDLESANVTITVNVHTVHVEGTITRNGAIPTVDPIACSAQGSAAIVRFSRSAWYGDSTFEMKIPCGASTFDFSGEILPGKWMVEVALADGPERVTYDSFGDASYRRFIEVGREVVIDGAQSPLVLNVSQASVSGHITLNGATPAIRAACDVSTNQSAAFVDLFDPVHGIAHQIRIPCDRTSFDFSGEIIPGTNWVGVRSPYVRANELTSDIPHQEFALDEPVALTGSNNTLDVDVKQVTVDLEVRVNGVVPTVVPAKCPTDKESVPFAGQLSLSSELTFDEFTFVVPCPAGVFEFPGVTLYPGSYEPVLYGLGEGRSTLGDHSYRRSPIVIDGSTRKVVIDFAFDPRTYPLVARVRWNGEPVPRPLDCSSGEPAARLYVSSIESSAFGRVEFPCENPTAAVEVDLPPGEYLTSVELHPELQKAIGLENRTLPSRHVTLTGPSAQTFDMETRRINGTLLVDGQPPKILRPCTGGGAAVGFLPQIPYEPSNGALVPCAPDGMNFTTFVTPGIHTVRVTGLPWNYLENKPKQAFTNVPQTSVIVLPALEVP